MSIFLGISSLDCDSTASFVVDGKLVYAAQEERFTRVKQQAGFPFHAIQNGLKFLGLNIQQVSDIGFPWYEPEKEKELYLKSGSSSFKEFVTYRRPLMEGLRHLANVQRRGRIINYNEYKKVNEQLQLGLENLGWQKPLKRYHHQKAHVASAYYTSGFDKALLVTLDGNGSGCAGAVYIGVGSELKLIYNIPSPQSVGLMYARVTKALDFIPNRHEGKVLGLAAYGNPEVFFKDIMKDFRLTEDGYIYLNALDPYKYKDIFKKGSKEDLAASFQKVLETVVVHLVRQNLQKFKLSKVCLAGGVAANVKMNQRIMELSECDEIFVHPGMADCGTGTGVAFLMAQEEKPFLPYRLNDVFLGPEYSENEMLTALGQFDFPFSKLNNPELEVAKLLAQGFVVGRFNGRMEYGPRALCNRTILAPAKDAGINNWLNKRLNRTEFMPFAPVTLDHAADRMYLNMDKMRYTAELMTITTDCSEEMKKLSPATVHVDGTARPQIVTARNNPSMYKILEHYYTLTLIPNLVNTSYNMHEEPIVCSPYDALKAFKDGRLDYLSIGKFIVSRNQITESASEQAAKNEAGTLVDKSKID